MKTFFLFMLFVLVSCSDKGGGEGRSSTGKVISGDIEEEKAARELIQESVKTLPTELKISFEDKAYIQSELNLTSEEVNTLNQLL